MKKNKFVKYSYKKIEPVIITDEIIPKYDGDNDVLWNKLKEKYNVNVARDLTIVTYGTTFIFEIPKQCQVEYNVIHLRGVSHNYDKPTKKALAKLRGTDLQIQQDVRMSNEIFEKTMNDIVFEIEQKNLTCIAIVCRAGHHRSVSCAEMLKYLYKNAITQHLTIDT